MKISKEFTFDAAHYLTKYHGKCENLHGHTYRLRVTVEGDLGEEDMVMDFADLKGLVKEKVLGELDHGDLNKLFENPTAELIAKWIWAKLEGADELGAARLYEVRLWETADSFVTYRG